MRPSVIIEYTFSLYYKGILLLLKIIKNKMTILLSLCWWIQHFY
jgi:hypothetical protein